MKVINVGVIGFGFMGKTHIYGYKTIPLYYSSLPFKINLIGICANHLGNAQNACETLGFEYATDDMQKIINDKRIDTINICTPNYLHKQALLSALDAGKNIYCDKPLTISYADASEVAKKAKITKVITQMALQYRFYPATLRAKQLIEQGALGRILSFRACYLHSGSVDPNKPIGWKQDLTQGGGGVLVDLGSHVLDLLYHLMGEVNDFTCKTQIIYEKRPDKNGKMIYITAEDAAYMILSMKNGAMGTVEVSKIATGSNDELRLEIHGDKGAISFNLMEPDWLDFYDNSLPDKPLGGRKGYTRIECVGRYETPGNIFPGPKFTIGWLRGHVHCLYNFLSCISENRSASPSFEDACYIQGIIENAERKLIQ